MAWRRKWLVLVPFVLVATATIVVASRMPDRFRAETVIMVVPQRVSQEYVRAAVTGQISDRLPLIALQILSRTRLERIINDFDLYQEERRRLPMEVVVQQMRADIDLQTVSDAESFRVSYEAADPLSAMQVTERLAGLFIEENLRDRETLAREASDFLESQLEDARRRLVEQEQRLEAYRLKYGPELPTQLASNLQVIQNTQMQLQTLEEALNRDRDRRLLLERQLGDLQSEQAVLEPGAVSSAATRLEAAYADLRALERRLQPEHPDVIRARQVIVELERAVRQEAASPSRAEVETRPPTAAELVKRNRVSGLQAEMESLDRQMADKTREADELRASLQTYQARIEAVPTRESDLASLTRDYDTLQGLYRDLLKKKEDSKVAENLERKQVGEQFKIVDPARRPERPFRPDRRRIDLIGAVAGLALGIGLAALLEFQDKSVRTETDVAAAVSLPVLAMIPSIVSRAERRKARWRMAASFVALALFFGACGTVMWITLLT
jgi:polysaccharide chain length determinant protein (PEP-CTERM system associated)